MSFASELRTALDARVAQGANGIDLSKKGPSNIIYRNYHMDGYVFDLACKINEAKPINPHQWANWMTDALIRTMPDGVRVIHRTAFFCDGARARFGGILADYFKRPVHFVPDHNIEARVAP